MSGAAYSKAGTTNECESMYEMQSEYHHKKFGKSRSELVGGDLTRQGPAWNLENYNYFFLTFKLLHTHTITKWS